MKRISKAERDRRRLEERLRAHARMRKQIAAHGAALAAVVDARAAATTRSAPKIDFGPRCRAVHPETGQQCHYVPAGHGGTHEAADRSRWGRGPQSASAVDGPWGTWVYDPGTAQSRFVADSAPGEEELSARLRTPPEALGWSKPMPDLVIHNPTGEPRPVELINGKPTDAELGVYEFGSLPEDLRRGTLADERKATSEGGPDEAEPGVVR